MDTNKAIEMLYGHHKEFIKMAVAISGNNREVKNYAEDFVQEAYIRLSKYDDLYDKIVVKGKVTKGYMFFTLRSLIINSIKKKTNLNYVFDGSKHSPDAESLHEMTTENDLPDDFVAYNILEEKMYNILKTKGKWWDHEMFKKYVTTGKSFRVIAEESGLGIRTIYLSLKRSKLLIAEHLEEDYIDFVNGDFHLIEK